jgi:hypothetical protein
MTRRAMIRFLLLLAVGLVATVPAAYAKRDPNDPKLTPVTADVRAAKTLLLRRTTLGGSFQASPSGVTPTNDNNGGCAGFDPNLRSLTETAEVYGDVLVDRSEGLLFTSEAGVFVSAAQASRAVVLQTQPGAGRCMASSARKAAGAGAVVLKKKVTPVAFLVGGLDVKGWDAVLVVKLNGRQLAVESTVFFYRHGRAVSALAFAGISDRAALLASEGASRAMARAILRANLR